MSRARARWQAVPPSRQDLLFALVLTVGGVIEALAEDDGGARGVTVVATIVVCGCLAVRRSRPLAAVVVVNLAVLIQEILGGAVLEHGDVPVIAIVVVIYSLGAYAEGVDLAVGIAIQAAGFVIGTFAFSTTGSTGGDLVFGELMGCAIPVTAGIAVRNRRRLIAELHRRSQELVAQRESRARGAVAAERARIAGELHDVVSHSVSVMVVQAGAARRLIATDAARASEAMMAIESTGRAALDEMRRLLGVLRRGDEELALAPQPTLRRVDRLVEIARGYGLAASLEVQGDAVDLPLGLDVAAYRIVQEALASAQAHAPGADTRVVVRYGRSELELEVVNAPAPRPEGAARPGSVLVGLRERVALFGGELQAGRRRGGGYALRASLPLVGSES